MWRWSWCVVLGAAWGCAAPTRALGEACVFNGDCDDPLVCAGHRCRAPCRDDRDCVNGWRCRPSGQSSLRVCLAPAEYGFCVAASDCPAPSVCDRAGQCGAQCASDYDCQLHGADATCRRTAQDPTLRLCTDHPMYTPWDGGAASDAP